MSDSNIDNLKQIKTESLCREIIAKTERCGLVWSQTTPTQFTSISSDETEYWTFIIGKTTANTYALDILSHNKPYMSIKSDDVEAVKELFDIVFDIIKSDIKNIDKSIKIRSTTFNEL